MEDPAFAGVVFPRGRLRVKALQRSTTDIHDIASAHLGPKLGLSVSFNALDGDWSKTDRRSFLSGLAAAGLMPSSGWGRLDHLNFCQRQDFLAVRTDWRG